MLYFTIDGEGNDRIAKVAHFNTTTLFPGHQLDEVNITNPTVSTTGVNHTVAYRPRYQDINDFGHGGSNTNAAFFINMENAFPCTRNSNYRPVCKMFTNDEDGFRSYRSIIEVADYGNHIHIFSHYIATYGFGVQGCPEFTKECLPKYHELVIVCYSPCKN